MRTMLMCGLLVALWCHASAEEASIEYVDDYFCRDVMTYEALDEYLDLNRIQMTEPASHEADSVTGTSVGSFIQKFNARTNAMQTPWQTPCPHIKGYVLVKNVGVYQPPWMQQEGFPALLVEIRIPSVLFPEDRAKWPALYGLKANQHFYCDAESEPYPNNMEAAAALSREYMHCGLQGL